MKSSNGTHAPENLSLAVNDLVAEGGRALASDDKRVSTTASWNHDIAHLPDKIRARLMVKYSIVYNGVHYERAGYCYDELADAVRYARIQRSIGINVS